MTWALLYHLVNIIMATSIILLLIILYSRLEIKENRALFLAAIGTGIDLVSWFAISYMTSIDGAIVTLHFSILGKTFFGAGSIKYIADRYRPKFARLIGVIWGLSIISMFVHSFIMTAGGAFLSDVKLVEISGIYVLKGIRGPVYYYHVFAVMLVGFWAGLQILEELTKNRESKTSAQRVNDMFYFVTVVLMGMIYVIYEAGYDIMINYLPMFKAFSLGIYAVLSIKFRFLDYNSLALSLLMKDMGAGLVAINANGEIVYANDIAKEIFPSIEGGNFYDKVARDAIEKREFQLERMGKQLKITTDRVVTNGHLDGYSMLIVDITDIVELQKRALLNEEARKNMLTNLSHELRTPLNSLIGASEIICAEDTNSETAKECADIIKASSISMDDLINNILSASNDYDDFVDAELLPYSVCTLVDSALQMCRQRVARKKIKVNVSFANDVPIHALGPDRGIRQVLFNVLSNAVRFTEAGAISLDVSGEYISENEYEYVYLVTDTGSINYKEGEDFDAVFESGNEFGVEYTSGYAIGLLVAKKIANSIGGNLSVRTIGGRGTVYSIRIPSGIVDDKTLSKLEFNKKMVVTYIGAQDDLYSDVTRVCRDLDVRVESAQNFNQLRAITGVEVVKHFLMFDYDKMGKKVASSERANGYVKVAVLKPEDELPESNEDYIFVKQPISTITCFAAYQEYIQRVKNMDVTNISFVAPKAKILVVDDNELNLSIAQHMLENFKATVDIAASGYECLELISSGKTYDLIFMDYMMEGIDGMETTRQIRKLSGQIRNVPIIAYTANSVKGAEEMYLNAGMNGVIFKPATIRAFSEILKNFLPVNYIVYDKLENAPKKTSEDNYPNIEGIDKETAIKYSGGNSGMYLEMLSSFYAEKDRNENRVIECDRNGDIKEFVVAVHGIKGLARTLGMTELAERMFALEKAGKEENLEYIKTNLKDDLSFYRKQCVLLVPYITIEEEKKNLSGDEVVDVLIDMRNALDEFETDKAEKLFSKIWPGEYSIERTIVLENLRQALARADHYSSKELVDNLLKTYEN